jgi:DNA-binding XRE family transcriptional regulator
VAIPFKKVMKRWMKEPGFKAGYDALTEEYVLARLLIEARMRAKLSQVELAERMGTSQSAIARLESGKANPSLATLRRLARSRAQNCESRWNRRRPARRRSAARGLREPPWGSPLRRKRLRCSVPRPGVSLTLCPTPWSRRG